MKIRAALPLIIFIVIGTILWWGLKLHPEQVPSPLINKPVPSFSLPILMQKRLATEKDFLGHVSLLNVWATWCNTCAEEHDFLLTLARDPSLVIYGLDYKDETAAAVKLLRDNGNPYQMVMLDTEGSVAIDWGVYGTPETFIVDKKGIIRYKHIGALTPAVWDEKIKPLIDTLRNEPE
jgi:cytochrome c biogenesis protein CcmG/thiol:disulfide interchange protein DsbE